MSRHREKFKNFIVFQAVYLGSCESVQQRVRIIEFGCLGQSGRNGASKSPQSSAVHTILSCDDDDKNDDRR